MPLWTGLIARINQGLGRNVGYLNPLLYKTLGRRRSCGMSLKGTTELTTLEATMPRAAGTLVPDGDSGW